MVMHVKNEIWFNTTFERYNKNSRKISINILIKEENDEFKKNDKFNKFINNIIIKNNW